MPQLKFRLEKINNGIIVLEYNEFSQGFSKEKNIGWNHAVRKFSKDTGEIKESVIEDISLKLHGQIHELYKYLDSKELIITIEVKEQQPEQ